MHEIKHENAHGRPDKLDPRVNGPYLDDIRREQERAYREARMAAEKSKEPAEDDTQDFLPVAEEEENNADGE